MKIQHRRVRSRLITGMILRFAYFIFLFYVAMSAYKSTVIWSMDREVQYIHMLGDVVKRDHATNSTLLLSIKLTFQCESNQVKLAPLPHSLHWFLLIFILFLEHLTPPPQQ